ncbi:hypothetical protein QBC36DRAFT_23904 [Triangularia setosa]|uniref:Uncharacterized protein n=1 Tax=Triangularia setosa TaxID=2587417 RepID=A0AAN7A6U2_9PEZI|nr:hypothetical protein QBC36DRAFT_23904 [Podospora setosa]
MELMNWQKRPHSRCFLWMLGTGLAISKLIPVLGKVEPGHHQLSLESLEGRREKKEKLMLASHTQAPSTPRSRGRWRGSGSVGEVAEGSNGKRCQTACEELGRVCGAFPRLAVTGAGCGEPAGKIEEMEARTKVRGSIRPISSQCSARTWCCPMGVPAVSSGLSVQSPRQP